MNKVLEDIAKALVEHPEDVTVTEVEKDASTVLELRVNKDDMGKVIGKQGKIAKALRTIVRSATPAGDKRYVLEIKERDGNVVNKE